MSESKSSEPLPLSRTPDSACHYTQEKIERDYPDLKGTDDCPLCARYRVSCPVGSHPTATSLASAQATAAPPAESRIVDVGYAKSTKKSATVTFVHHNFSYCESLDDFMDIVASHCNLNQIKFNVFSGNVQHTASSWADLAERTFPVSVTVRVDSVGFSDWTLDRIQEVCGIVEFPTVRNLFEQIEIPLVDIETAIVVQELLRRIKCVRQGGAKENTMREFISPILIAAVNMCNNDNLEFRAEFPIKGWTGNGPVDYDFLYKLFHICVAEAKKNEIDGAVPQNFGQLVCSRDVFESAMNVMNGNSKKRKRDWFPDSDTVSLKSVGIVTSGSEWMFTQLYYEEHAWKMVKSETMLIPLTATATAEVLTAFVKPVLGTLYSILLSQMAAVDNYRDSKRPRLGSVDSTT